MSGWQILMPTDSDHAAFAGHRTPVGPRIPTVQVISVVHNDARLIAGASAVAGHAARQAGLAEEAEEHLATATAEACRELFAGGRLSPKSPPQVTLTVSRFADRVEIAVELAPAPAKSGAASRAKKALGRDGKHRGKLVETGLVDEIQRGERDGRPLILLVKHLRPLRSKV